MGIQTVFVKIRQINNNCNSPVTKNLIFISCIVYIYCSVHGKKWVPTPGFGVRGGNFPEITISGMVCYKPVTENAVYGVQSKTFKRSEDVFNIIDYKSSNTFIEKFWTSRQVILSNSFLIQ